MSTLRLSRAFVGTLLLVSSALSAQVQARADDLSIALELPDAQRLALTQQPLLEAQAQAVTAARANAVAAAQLPDPKLTVGLADWPIEGAERYSLRRDDFTMVTAGVTQDFPRAEKRRLRGARGEHEAELAEQVLTANRLMVARDAGLAWLNAWKPERSLELLRASAREAELQVQATEIAYTAGRATQAEVLAARVSLELLRDEAADAEQQAQDARGELSRWIGNDEARRPLSTALPSWAPPVPLADSLAKLRAHPHLNAETRRVAILEDDVALAKQAYKPDWGVELGYGHRPDFADFVSVNVTVDLPVFTGNRQDPGLGAKLAEQEQAAQARADMFRQEEAELRRHWESWQRLQDRVTRFDSVILPQSAQRTAAALAAWQAGQGTLAAVLDARRMALDNRMKRLDLVTDAARRRVHLLYFAGE